MDDDASVRKALRRLMRSAGFEVLAFESAEDFIDFSRCGAPGCVVVDVQMPGMNGLDLQEHLNDSGSRLPVIFITAYEDDHVRARAMNAGATEFLQKPFDDKVLIGAIHSALRQTQTR
ncbi:MAG: response regulator [Gemmatimonadetes bacterium]|nr:response regulator [Gemmatimonadota bacterium]